MFAISDGEYICTSQIVAKIKENIIDKGYLCFMLRKILPTLEVQDLVGRETYRPAEILSLRIPKPEYFPPKIGKEIMHLTKERDQINLKLAKIERELSL